MFNYTDYFGSYYNVNGNGLTSMDRDDIIPYTRKLELSMEKQYNEPDKNIGSKYRGWFIAPATTNYRFYAACDDRCSLSISTTPDSTDDMNLIIDNLARRWPSRRNYLGSEKQISEWVSLTEGEAYYIEGRHYVFNGENFYTVGVEIE